MLIMTQMIRTLWRNSVARMVLTPIPVVCFLLPAQRMILLPLKLPNGLCMLWRKFISVTGSMFIPVITSIIWLDMKRCYLILLKQGIMLQGKIKGMMGWLTENGLLMLIIYAFMRQPMEIICLLFTVRVATDFLTGSIIHWYLWIIHPCMNFGHWYGDYGIMLIQRLISVTTNSLN